MLIVEMLARMPDLRRRIYADHVCDRAGYCRDCRSARWPCEMVRLAAEADRRDGTSHLGPSGPGGYQPDAGRMRQQGWPGPARPGAQRLGTERLGSEQVAWPRDHPRGLTGPVEESLPQPRGAEGRYPRPDERPTEVTVLAAPRDQLSAGSDELRARREEVRARREELRARRNGSATQGATPGRHDFGRDAAPATYSNGASRRVEVIDALEDVLRWSH